MAATAAAGKTADGGGGGGGGGAGGGSLLGSPGGPLLTAVQGAISTTFGDSPVVQLPLEVRRVFTRWDFEGTGIMGHH